MRHSEPLKCENVNNNDSLQIQNEKWCLTLKGESIASKKSEINELKDFDAVFSSNYVRAISTAKYFTSDKIFIDESFGERKFGIESWNELPEDFSNKQFNDFDYKTQNGESLNEVINREVRSLLSILEKYKNKNVLVVGHSTALAALFSKWCEITITGTYKFNTEEFFDGKWNYCETFKLIFDDNYQLISIKNIR
jgi:2,3-bisphosphoglycerate-dependent phosphoglycerate mutase